MAYEVHLDVYDGPFNLLLQLITADEVDVYAVRLTEIVDAFLAEIRRLEALDLEAATEFLLIAATLVELKCRRLLPSPEEVELDEEVALYEARDYLLARLVECKTFTAAASVFCELETRASRSVARRVGPDERFCDLVPDLLVGLRPEQLRDAARRALAARPAPVVSADHVHDDEVTVAEALDHLVGLLPGRGRVTFGELLAGDSTKARFVATFLALLELYKRELVELDQPVSFGDLTVTWTGDRNGLDLSDVERYDDSLPVGGR